MSTDELIEKAEELKMRGYTFEFYTFSTGWFVNKNSDSWILRTPQGAALPFYEALKKTIRTIEYLQ